MDFSNFTDFGRGLFLMVCGMSFVFVEIGRAHV